MKIWLDCINLFSPNEYEKNYNNKIFSITIALFGVRIENFQNLKYDTLPKNP